MKLLRGLDNLWGQRTGASNSLSNFRKELHIEATEPANRVLRNKIGRGSVNDYFKRLFDARRAIGSDGPARHLASGEKELHALGPGQPPVSNIT